MTRLNTLTLFTLCALLACRHEPRELVGRVGRQMVIQVDAGRHTNDVAFWFGTPPNDMLAVVARDLRTEHERATGAPADRSIRLLPNGIQTLRGTIERAPDAERTYSWGLTRADSRRLAAKGVYLRLHTLVP